MILQTLHRRPGITSLEVLFAAVLGSILAFSAIALMVRGNHEAVVSEDYMFAEALAQRYLADALSQPWKELEEELAQEAPLIIPLQGVPPEDQALADLHQEYRHNLEGPGAFRGELQIQLLEPGLLVFEIHLHWPVRVGGGLERNYNLVRLRSRKDLALSSRFALPPPQDSPEKSHS
jgi:hypothetical protein